MLHLDNNPGRCLPTQVTAFLMSTLTACVLFIAHVRNFQLVCSLSCWIQLTCSAFPTQAFMVLITCAQACSSRSLSFGEACPQQARLGHFGQLFIT